MDNQLLYLRHAVCPGLTHDTFHVVTGTVVEKAADKNNRREQSDRLESSRQKDSNLSWAYHLTSKSAKYSVNGFYRRQSVSLGRDFEIGES